MLDTLPETTETHQEKRYPTRHRCIFLPLLCVTPPTEGFPWDDLLKSCTEVKERTNERSFFAKEQKGCCQMSKNVKFARPLRYTHQDGYGTKWRRNTAVSFNPSVGRTNVTDDRRICDSIYIRLLCIAVTISCNWICKQ